MIQELLGDILEERKISFNPGALTASSSSSLKSSPSPVSSPATSSEPQPSLRCPRCESINTKFCYYNNYNLTQPRHFCKTCRRYWTKGGALRNVPIGGGCRKARPKPKSDRPCPALGFDPDLPAPGPVPWASTPYSSQLMALLRASQFQNANPNVVLSPITNPDLITNSYKIKEEAGLFGSQLGMGFDQLAVGPSGRQFQQQQHNSLLLGEVLHHHQQQQQQQSSGTQDLYQRLRSLGNYNHEPSTTAMASSPLLMEPLPLAGGEMGYWNPAMSSWADLPTAANGTAFL